MVHGSLPIQIGQGLALGIRDRHHGDIRIRIVNRYEVRNIKTPMQCGDMQIVFANTHWIMQVVKVEMNQVKVILSLGHFLQHGHMVSQMVDAATVQSQ